METNLTFTVIRVCPSRKSQWKFGFSLLEGLLASTASWHPESAASILQSIFSHKILTFILLRDESGSIATLSIDLGGSIVQQMETYSTSVDTALNNPNSFLHGVANRFTAESDFWQENVLGALTHIAHYVRDPLRQTVLNIAKVRLSRKTHHVPLYISKMIQTFSLKYVDGIAEVDWQFQSFLLQLPISESIQMDHLLKSIEMTTPLHLGVNCGLNCLSSIIKLCINSQVVARQLLLAEFVKAEPLCRAVYERELVISLVTIEHKHKLLPSALEYLLSLRQEQVAKNLICELFCSSVIEGLSEICKNEIHHNGDVSERNMLKEYGICFLMHYCSRRKVQEDMWCKVMGAILPESSWLQLQGAMREGFMTLATYMINTYVCKVGMCA